MCRYRFGGEGSRYRLLLKARGNGGALLRSNLYSLRYRMWMWSLLVGKGREGVPARRWQRKRRDAASGSCA